MVQTTGRAFGSPLKYIQGPGEFNNLQKYTSIYGEKAYFLIDGFLHTELNARLKEIYAETGSCYETAKFGGECCQSEIDRVTEAAKAFGAQIFVGVGGGKTLDTAKFVANGLETPLIIMPTAASTDAPVSELGILYTEKGEHRAAVKMKRNSEIVLMDTEIILKAPKRLFIAGIADALATWFEARANDASDHENYIGTGYRRCKAGMAIAKMAYDILMVDGLRAVQALERGALTEAVENVIEANTLLSGLGFQNTGCSTAHGIHSGLTELPCTHKYLHGEKVAFGIVVQMVLENTPAEELDRIMRFLVKLGLPVTLGQMDIDPTPENVSAVAHKTTKGNSLIYSEPFLITEDLVYNAIIAADEIGRSYLAEN